MPFLVGILIGAICGYTAYNKVISKLISDGKITGTDGTTELYITKL